MVTKVELLAEAEELGLEGTDGLNKAELEAVVEAARPAAEVVEEAVEAVEDVEAVEETVQEEVAIPRATTTQGGGTFLTDLSQ
jgi:translation elongation factor EF-1beta